MTVIGPLPVSSLGVVETRDHLLLRSPALAGDEFDDLERSTAEAAEGRDSGTHGSLGGSAADWVGGRL